MHYPPDLILQSSKPENSNLNKILLGNSLARLWIDRPRWELIPRVRRKLAYGNPCRGAERRFRRVFELFKEAPPHKDSPAKVCGEGWLVNAQQQKVVQFQPDASTVHAE